MRTSLRKRVVAIGLASAILTGAEISTTALGSQNLAVDASVSGLSPAEANDMAAIATSDEWVAARLAAGATRLVEVSDPGDGKTGVLVRFIDYSEMRPFAVIVDKSKRIVIETVAEDSWPNYSPSEFRDASVIALADLEVAQRSDGATLVVNNMTGATDRGICVGRRCIAVFLTRPDGSYGHLIVAIVDLGKRDVVSFDQTD